MMIKHFQRVGIQFWFLLPFLLAVLSGVVFLIVVITRALYPFELEWIEGAYLDQARWVLSGRSLYSTPVIDFIPTNKTPVFFLLSALFILILGEGFLAVRLLSILAVLGTVTLLGMLVYKDSKRFSAAGVSIGLYLISFQFTGSWMDLGKTDSLFLFFVLVGYYWQRANSIKFHWVFMAIAYVLSYYTKQLALPILVVMALISLVANRFRSWRGWLLTGVLGLGVFGGLDYTTRGWFSFYTLDTTIHHQIDLSMLWQFWGKVLPALWPSLLIVGIYSVRRLWKIREKKESFADFAVVMSLWLGLLAASWSVFFKVWTYDNDLMPIALGSALIGGLAYGEYANWYKQELGRKQSLYWSAIVLLIGVQFFNWRYNPQNQLPTQHDLSLGEYFVAHLAKLEGDVWVFNHGFYTAQAGKRTFLHSAPLGDVAGVVSPDDLPEDTLKRRNQTLNVVRDAVESQRFSWIIVDKSPKDWLPQYLLVERFFEDKEGFFPVAGAPTRPEYGLLRNPVVYGGDYPLESPLFDVLFTGGWMPTNASGRRLLGKQGSISISLLPEEPYSLDMRLFPRCLENQPVTKSVGLYWNERFLIDMPTSDCTEIALDQVSIPTDSITGSLDALKFDVQLVDEYDGNDDWNLEVRELSFLKGNHSVGP